MRKRNAMLTPLIPTGGDENIQGWAGTNVVLQGLGGNDTLLGTMGDDTLDGGTGNETFVVNDAGDVVIADANAANDARFEIRRMA